MAGTRPCRDRHATMVPMSAYPTYAEIRERRLAALRAEAIAAARAAAAAAAEHGARVIVFGSVATGRMHERSDLDLALDGPEEAQAAAWVPAWWAAAGEGFEPDVVQMRLAKPAIAERVRRDGRDPADLV